MNTIEKRIREEEVAKYTVKDSVFTNLFREKKYLLQLYKVLHPEDHTITEQELTDITIHNILTDDIYNDLGFQAGDRLLILVEAQSTWTVNMVIRILIYLMATYQEYLRKTKQNIYKSKKVELPKPELYVIYTGDRKERRESIRFSEEFFQGEECCIEVTVKVLYDGREGDILNQYVTFTKVYNEQRELYGRTRKAILETIRICRDRNILKEYLKEREKEVVSIMLALYDEKEILRDYIESERYEAAREATERAEKKAAAETRKAVREAAERAEKKAAAEIKKAERKAAAEARKATEEAVIQMLKEGSLSVEQIARYFPVLSIEDIRKLQE